MITLSQVFISNFPGEADGSEDSAGTSLIGLAGLHSVNQQQQQHQPGWTTASSLRPASYSSKASSVVDLSKVPSPYPGHVMMTGELDLSYLAFLKRKYLI